MRYVRIDIQNKSIVYKIEASNIQNKSIDTYLVIVEATEGNVSKYLVKIRVGVEISV